MSSRDPAMSEGLRRVLARLDPQVRDVTNLTRLSAGATNETWSLDAVRDAGVEPLILRRSAVGRGPGVLTLQAEAQVLSAVHGCERTGPRNPLRARAGRRARRRIRDAADRRRDTAGQDPARSSARTVRPRLASQLGSIAAAIHAVDLSRLPQLPLLDAERQVQHLHSQYRAQETPRPVFELAFRWLREHLPPAVAPALVHGDYRHGNLIIGRARRARSARLGARAQRRSRRGSRVDVHSAVALRRARQTRRWLRSARGSARAYERASGRSIDRARLEWWDVLGSLRWGIMCADMPKWLRSGRDTSVERAMIARRASESELDLLRLLAPREGSSSA